MTVPLVAVIGPVEPGLLEAFIGHYRSLGITRFHLAFHFADDADSGAVSDVLTACRDLAGPPDIVSTGPWHETLHGQLRDRLRSAAGPGWHLIADSDEFHSYPKPIASMIRDAEETGSGVVGGVLLDRISSDGSVTSAPPARTPRDLDRAYPLGGFLTHRLLHGDPRKIVLARDDITLALGSHRSPGNRPANSPPAAVHHFKWRPGITDDLARRVQHHHSGHWHEETAAIRTEAGTFLDHLRQNDGHISLTCPGLSWRPVTIAALPGWWDRDASQVSAEFRPPGHQRPGAERE